MKQQWACANSRAPRSGFSLIELSAVVILLALVAGTATFIFREPYKLARQQATIDKLKFIDQHARRRAGKQPGSLNFDLNTGTAEWSTQERDSRNDVLAGSLQIDRIWTLSGGENRKSTVKIPFQPNGSSETYAVRTSNNGTNVRWQLFIGLTGQYMEIGNDRESDTVIQSLTQNRPDAN